jgi:hypothetical protein
MANNNYLIEEKDLPENLQTINPAPLPASPPGIQDFDRYSGGALPPGLGLQTDLVKTNVKGSAPVYRLMPAPPSGNPQQGSASQSSLLKNPAFVSTQTQTQQNTQNLQEATNPPGYVTGLSVAKGIGKNTDGTLSQIVELSFTPPAANPNLGTFAAVEVFATGYNGSPQPTLVGQGVTSPVFIETSITGETIALICQSVSSTGIYSAFSTAPTISTTLNGVTTAPPAPSIASGLAATNAGVSFSFSVVPDPTHDYIAGYKIYKNSSNTTVGATVVDVISQPTTNVGTLVFQDTVAAGGVNFYWVSTTNTSGLESALTAAQSGAVVSGTVSSTFLGNWNSGTAYQTGNQVIDVAGGGGYFICLSANTNKQPSTNPSFWQLVTAGNLNSYAGNWSNATAYSVGQTVSYQGSLWVAIAAGTNNTPSLTSSFWTLLGSNGAFQGTWSSSTAYTQNMTVAYQGNLYQAVQASTNQTPSPTSSTFWQLSGPATLDNLLDGPVYIRGIQYQSTTLVIPNGNFEASASLPVPGWKANATLSYDTTTPQSGNQSLKVSSSFQFGGVISIQKWAVAPGDTYLISGYVKSDGTGLPQIDLQFKDKNGNLIGDAGANGTTSTAWAFTSASAVVPAGSVYAEIILQNTAVTQPSAVEFDQISALRLTTLGSEVKDGPSNFSATASGLVYRPLSNPLTGHDAGSNATIPVSAFTMRTSSKGDISDNSGSVTALSYNTLYFVYYDDATLAGGAVTYNATTTRETAINGTGRFFVGSVTTPVQGAADTIGNNDGGNGTGSSKYAVQIFSAAGTYTWTKLSGAQQVEVLMIGAGGGGGSGMVNVSPANRAGGGGGGGGGVSRNIFAASFLNSTETLVVGAGGTGGTAQTVTGSNGNNGNNGGDTSFGNYLRAGGGSGGGGGSSTGSGGGGGGVGNLGTGGGGGGTSSTFAFTGQAGATSSSMGAGGGGCAGGATSGGTITTGGAGANGSPIHNSTLTGGTAGTAGAGGGVHGGDGGSGTPPLVNEFIGGPGAGGGGGGATGGGVAGVGGAPSRYGGGGGGGGSTNGANSGVGGSGAPGIAIITTYF